MAKKAQYAYNPITDNYERIYPTMRSRLVKMLRILFWGALFWGIVLLILWLCFGFYNETYIVKENNELKTQYKDLENRVNVALNVMDQIRNRDDNFYRVMMQVEPVKRSQRFAGQVPETDYGKLYKLSDRELLEKLSNNLSLLERQLYVQSGSFDELRSLAMQQKNKIDHIPAILPINIADYTMSSGYGYRVDPVYGGSAFHAGLDFAAPTGTPVYATADGVINKAERAGGYGNKIDISHGFNYITRYAHLSKIEVTPGQQVKRGDKIGEVGSTGKSTGPHLHYEVRFKDEPQNPINYYFLDVTPEEYNTMVNLAENAGHVMD
ncbi:MAG: M23 family metallopeptidase [Prevotella sp.]|nr:M23 family metallopeptidase [Prevotella sp.]MCM1075531.1 M23 family metallopeptidase [Ruminococcus sp.]